MPNGRQSLQIAQCGATLIRRKSPEGLPPAKISRSRKASFWAHGKARDQSSVGVQAMNAKRFSLCLIVLGISVFALACGGRGSVRSSSAKPTLDPLRGSYVFFANGSDPRKGDYFVAGSFTADGRGNLSGVQDLKRGLIVDSGVELEGTYQLDAIGTVNASISDGTETLAALTFVIPSGSEKTAFLYNGTATGTVQRQNTSGFSNVGKFDFKLSGKGEEGE